MSFRSAIGDTVAITLAALGIAAFLTGPAHAGDCDYEAPSCVSCDANAFGSVVAEGAPQLSVAMKWTGVLGSPAVDNPGIVCMPNFKDMMWRRHERASECVWIDQAHVTLRSGGAVQSSDYKTIADADTSIGQPGDVFFGTINMSGSVDLSEELDQLWDDCDALWAAQPKGLVAVSCRELVDENGVSQLRGIAVTGSVTRPYLCSADPTLLCQLNERSLAHEAGHVLSLPHVTGTSSLMRGGGTGAALSLAECNQARQYILDNPIVDPPGDPDFVDFARDGLPDLPAALGHLDIIKTVVTDRASSQGRITFHIGTDGPLPTTGVFSYHVVLDSDNSPATGNNASTLLPGVNFPGANAIVRVLVDDGFAFGALFGPNGSGGWSIDEFFSADIRLRQPLIVGCDPFPTYDGPDVLGSFLEVEISVPYTELVANLVNGRAFPNGLRMMAVTFGPGGLLDMGPNTPAVLDFPAVTFPSISLPLNIFAGEDLPISVSGFPGNQPLKAFVGSTMYMPGITTSPTGTASFTLPLPADQPCGPTLVTVGIASGANAITADGITNIADLCRSDLDEDGDVDLGDLGLLLQSYQVNGNGDIDGDGETGLADLGALLQDYLACFCPGPLPAALNIDFSNNAGVPSSAFGAAAGQPGFWNVVVGIAPVPLLDIAGNATEATITASSGVEFANTGGPNGTKTPAGSDAERLMDDLFDLGNQPVARNFTITSLPPGSYRVFVYASAPDNLSFITNVTVNGAGPINIGGSWPSPFGFAPPLTHGVFGPFEISAGGTITVQAQPQVGFASMNGIQIVPTTGQTPPDRINLDCSNDAGVPTSAFGAAAGQPGVWNVATSPAGLALVDVNGLATGAVFSGTSGTEFSAVNAVNGIKTPLGSDAERLMDDLLDLGTGNRTLTVSQLEAGRYTVHVYASAPDSTTFTTAVTVNGQGPVFIGGVWNTPFMFNIGVTHGVYGPFDVPAGGAITIQTTPSVGFSTLNGLQLVGQ